MAGNFRERAACCGADGCSRIARGLEGCVGRCAALPVPPGARIAARARCHGSVVAAAAFGRVQHALRPPICATCAGQGRERCGYCGVL
jgi:hypothetical protein